MMAISYLDKEWLAKGYELNFYDIKEELVWKNSFTLSQEMIKSAFFYPVASFSYN